MKTAQLIILLLATIANLSTAECDWDFAFYGPNQAKECGQRPVAKKLELILFNAFKLQGITIEECLLNLDFSRALEKESVLRGQGQRQLGKRNCKWFGTCKRGRRRRLQTQEDYDTADEIKRIVDKRLLKWGKWYKCDFTKLVFSIEPVSCTP